MNDSVLVEIRDGIARVTLNRPAALNALNDAMVDGLVAAMAQVEADADARCVLLQGAGDHFMAGGDLKFFHGLLEWPPQGRREHFQDMIGRLHPAIVAMRTMPKPVVASLRGAAAGFGLSLALAADLAIAAEDAYFTLAYSLIGTSPDGGSSWHLPRLVGLRKAMEIALLGDRFDAAEAERLGLVNWVVPPDALEAESDKIAPPPGYRRRPGAGAHQDPAEPIFRQEPGRTARRRARQLRRLRRQRRLRRRHHLLHRKAQGGVQGDLTPLPCVPAMIQISAATR